MYRALNVVRPSLIRIEADEVTYALHIILRYEIERALIDGTLDPSDAPDAWNAKMRESFGIVPTGYADGIFQDGHWPSGAFGYFPSYTLGDIYAETLFAAAERDIPGLEAGFADGKFSDLQRWLDEKVHRVGGLQEASAIVTAASGTPATSETMLARFERKYGELYGF
jgi:carboxypeptidase Taq